MCGFSTSLLFCSIDLHIFLLYPGYFLLIFYCILSICVMTLYFLSYLNLLYHGLGGTCRFWPIFVYYCPKDSLIFRALASCSGLLHSSDIGWIYDQFLTGATYRSWTCFAGPLSVWNADSQSGWAWVLLWLVSGREIPGSAGIVPLDSMPTLLCSIELAKGFSIVYAGGLAHLSVPWMWSWRVDHLTTMLRLPLWSDWVANPCSRSKVSSPLQVSVKLPSPIPLFRECRFFLGFMSMPIDSSGL